ncbi:MAG: hypothetical protein ACXV2A_07340 [Halobacteriota archaeon]
MAGDTTRAASGRPSGSHVNQLSKYGVAVSTDNLTRPVAQPEHKGRDGPVEKESPPSEPASSSEQPPEGEGPRSGSI